MCEREREERQTDLNSVFDCLFVCVCVIRERERERERQRGRKTDRQKY